MALGFIPESLDRQPYRYTGDIYEAQEVRLPLRQVCKKKIICA